jgi:hypothetical protein
VFRSGGADRHKDAQWPYRVEHKIHVEKFPHWWPRLSTQNHTALKTNCTGQTQILKGYGVTYIINYRLQSNRGRVWLEMQRVFTPNRKNLCLILIVFKLRVGINHKNIQNMTLSIF